MYTFQQFSAKMLCGRECSPRPFCYGGECPGSLSTARLEDPKSRSTSRVPGLCCWFGCLNGAEMLSVPALYLGDALLSIPIAQLLEGWVHAADAFISLVVGACRTLHSAEAPGQDMRWMDGQPVFSQPARFKKTKPIYFPQELQTFSIIWWFAYCCCNSPMGTCGLVVFLGGVVVFLLLLFVLFFVFLLVDIPDPWNWWFWNKWCCWEAKWLQWGGEELSCEGLASSGCWEHLQQKSNGHWNSELQQWNKTGFCAQHACITFSPHFPFWESSFFFMHENNYFRVAFACWIGGNACVFSRLFCLLSYSSALHTDSNGT